MDLPDFARDVITNDVNLHRSVDQIEAMGRRCEPGDVVKLSPDSQGLVTLMNAGGEWRGHIERMYLGVSPAALEGVCRSGSHCLDQPSCRDHCPHAGGR
jgi:hypothetical protein